tara:strand:+ start:860 stop:1618 length:759 start_codon:yes stop_codon:yes gene_type:complete
MKKYNILKCKDRAEKYYTDKGQQLFNIPFKIGLIGASQRSGKTTIALNLLARKEYYLNDFEGSNMFIFSPSITNDDKLTNLIKAKKIPPENLFTSYSEEVLEEVYELIKEEYEDKIENKKCPNNYLIYFDDLGFSGDLRGHYNMIDKVVMNGRHLNISSIFAIQDNFQLSKQTRSNLSGLIVFSLSLKNLESVIEEHNYLDNKKAFVKMFRKITNAGAGHNFLVINYSNDFNNRYLDSNFMPIHLDLSTKKK